MFYQNQNRIPSPNKSEIWFGIICNVRWRGNYGRKEKNQSAPYFTWIKLKAVTTAEQPFPEYQAPSPCVTNTEVAFLPIHTFLGISSIEHHGTFFRVDMHRMHKGRTVLSFMAAHRMPQCQNSYHYIQQYCWGYKRELSPRKVYNGAWVCTRYFAGTYTRKSIPC